MLDEHDALMSHADLGTDACAPIFWPPNHERVESFTALSASIRERLGVWPSTPIRGRWRWRICLSLPETPVAGDLIVLAERHANRFHPWLEQGAGLIEIVSNRVTLHWGGAHYALETREFLDAYWPAAFASFLDCGFDPHDALVLALAWRGTGWPSDLACFPRVSGLPEAPPAFPSCPQRLGLYPVLPNAQWVERVLAMGVRTVQLRLKDALPQMLKREIAHAVAAGRRYDARVFINDHWQQAIDAGAYGVHLGQEDIQTADLYAIAAAGLRLGLSTHGYYEILKALHFQPSYLACGAIFPTATKTVATAPQGLARLERYVWLLDGKTPLVAIGGIDQAALARVRATGVGSAAVVSAITHAEDVAAAVAGLQQAFGGGDR